MGVFDWQNQPPLYGPFCKKSDWFPLSLPRISEDGRVCGGCAYFDTAKRFCLRGTMGGIRPEPGHGANYIFETTGSGNGRKVTVSSPWTVTSGYKMLSGSHRISNPLTELETMGVLIIEKRNPLGGMT
jgi:hypothetical protein